MALPQYLGTLSARTTFKWTCSLRNSLASKLINQTGNNITNNNEIHAQQEEEIEILAFQDEGAEEVAEAIKSNTSIPQIIPQTASKEGRTHDIPDFLKRVYRIDTFDWVQTNTQGEVLKTYRFPDNLLSRLPINNKVNNFLGLRAGVEFIVLVNKQPFQAGNLMISYLPHARYNNFKSDLHSKPYGIVARSGSPRVNLDLKDATRATMCVPFASPFVYYNLLRNTGTIGDFSISVYSPLRDVAATGRVGVRVYARFVDIDLQFPTGQVTTPVSTFGSLLPQIRSIVAGDPKKQLQELTKIKKEVDTFIRDFNHMVNQSNDTAVTSIKQKALPNMTTSNGSHETHMLSLSTNNSLIPMNMGAASSNEMNFQQICKIPTYYETIPITTSDIAGKEVWRKVVSPMVQPKVSGPVDGVVSDYLSFVSQPCQQWRGPIIYHFRSVATIFHSVRIRVGWSPVSDENATIDRDACYSEVVDLKDRNQWTLEVPYAETEPWLNVKSAYGPTFCNVIFMDIEIQMVAPDTVKDTIDIIVERSCGEGFELNLPTSYTLFPLDTRQTKSARRTLAPQPAPQPVQPVVERPPIHNPYLVPVNDEEERFDVSGQQATEPSLSFFTHLTQPILRKARNMISAGKSLPIDKLTIINDMLADGMSGIDKSFLEMAKDQLITFYEDNGGEKGFYTLLPNSLLMRKRSINLPKFVPLEGGGKAPIRERRDFSRMTNESNFGPGCEKMDQDLDRVVERSMTFTRPPAALQADNYTLGSHVNSVKQMISRSTRLNITGVPSATKPLHVQPHAFSPMYYDTDHYVRPANDNLSYYASLYTFSRGGVGLRIVNDGTPYACIVDPTQLLDLGRNYKFPPAGLSDSDWNQQDTYLTNNYITQIVNPQVEGFGEISIPFYSTSYCSSVNLEPTLNPANENLNLQQPKTHLVIVPYSSSSSVDFKYDLVRSDEVSGSPTELTHPAFGPTPVTPGTYTLIQDLCVALPSDNALTTLSVIPSGSSVALSVTIDTYPIWKVTYNSIVYCIPGWQLNNTQTTYLYTILNGPGGVLVQRTTALAATSVPWSLYRHASPDFEFSVLSGPPVLVSTTASD